MRLPLLALLASASALAASQGAARLWVGSGFDSNARRDFAGATGLAPEPDLVLSVLASAEGRYRGPSLQASGSYDVGAREFVRLPRENVVIQSAAADFSWAVGRVWGLGVETRGKDRRGGERDYTDLTARAFLEFVPDEAVELKLQGGAHRFLYWHPIRFSFGASEFGLSARFRFDRRHSTFVFGELGARRYMDRAQPRPEEPSPDPAPPRADQVLSGGAGYTYRGPFTFTLSYGYTEQASNSYGETVLRHRLSATGGVRLPAKLTLLAQAVWQDALYPEGVRLSDELNITEDEDTLSSLSAKLVRPLSEHLDTELKVAHYWGALPGNNLHYSRQLAWLGMTWRL